MNVSAFKIAKRKYNKPQAGFSDSIAGRKKKKLRQKRKSRCKNNGGPRCWERFMIRWSTISIKHRNKFLHGNYLAEAGEYSCNTFRHKSIQIIACSFRLSVGQSSTSNNCSSLLTSSPPTPLFSHSRCSLRRSSFWHSNSVKIAIPPALLYIF